MQKMKPYHLDGNWVVSRSAINKIRAKTFVDKILNEKNDKCCFYRLLVIK